MAQIPPMVGPQTAQTSLKRNSERKEAALLLANNGVDPKTAASLVGYSERTAYALASSLKKYSLTQPAIIKEAHSAIKSALKNPDDNVKLKAAKMVYDRAEPVVLAAPPAPVQSFIQINIGKVEEAARLIQAAMPQAAKPVQP